MKVRVGYVSNSSSSSFVCDVCGRVESGYDCSPSDFEMHELECGHTVCSHEINKKITLKQIKEFIEDSDLFELIDEINLKIEKKGVDYILEQSELEDVIQEIEGNFGSYEMPKFLCPICNMKHISDSNKYRYVLNKFGLDDNKIIEQIQNNYSDIDKFDDDMKKMENKNK